MVKVLWWIGGDKLKNRHPFGWRHGSVRLVLASVVASLLRANHRTGPFTVVDKSRTGSFIGPSNVVDRSLL